MQMDNHAAVNLAESDCDTYASRPNRGFDQADEPAVLETAPQQCQPARETLRQVHCGRREDG